MSSMLSRCSIRKLSLMFLLSATVLCGAVKAGVDSTYSLPPNEWHQISVPAALSPRDEQNTVEAVFADDFEPGTYGSQWILWEYIVEAGEGSYKKPQLTDRILPGVGFWIAHIQESTVTIDLPETSTVATGISDGACGQGVPCIRVPVANGWPVTGSGFSMVGKPTTRPTVWDDLLVGTTAYGPFSACHVDFNLEFSDPCFIGGADDSGVASQYGYRYDNSLTPPDYSEISYDNYASSVIEDWASFWFNTFGTEDANMFVGFPTDPNELYSCPCQFDETVGIDFSDVVNGENSSLYTAILYTQSDRGELENFVLDASSPLQKPGSPEEQLTLGDLSSTVFANFPGVQLTRPVLNISAFVGYDADKLPYPGYCFTQVQLEASVDSDDSSAPVDVEYAQIPFTESPEQNPLLDTTVHNVNACVNDLLQSKNDDLLPSE